MANKRVEKELQGDSIDLDLDSTNEETIRTLIPSEPSESEVINNNKKEDKSYINPLRKEIIIVKYIPKQNSNITNPKHVLFGGIAEGATRTFVVPRLTSGIFVNVLTNSEKDYLEDLLGLEHNALSIYKKVNNFWEDTTEHALNKVVLRKEDTRLDLSNPEDYIKYKILLANKDYIAPSLRALKDYPKATYQFVITSEGETNNEAKIKMNTTMESYKEYGKIENDIHTLKTIIEIIEGRPLADNIKLDYLQTKINNLIQTNSTLFLSVIKDELLSTKVIIKRAINNGIIYIRGNYYYLREGNIPLCNPNQEPTLNVAASYLNMPKNQELLFTIQSKLED